MVDFDTRYCELLGTMGYKGQCWLLVTFVS